MLGGQGKSGMELFPAPAPLPKCIVQLLDTERCCTLLGSFVTPGGVAGAQGRQPGLAGQGVGVCWPSAVGHRRRP